MDSVVIKGLEFGYTNSNVIEGLDLNIKNGELVIIVGENGSGKSTLLKLMLGELKPDGGKIALAGKNLTSIKDFREIGYLPQVNTINKISFPITCLELVALNLYRDFGLIKIPRKKHLKKAADMLREMGLEEYIDVPFNELSGGLQQRVMISRIMINNPELIILDEPTAGVDEESKVKLFEYIQRLNSEYNRTVILVTHEVDTAKEHLNLDHIYYLENGGLRNVAI